MLEREIEERANPGLLFRTERDGSGGAKHRLASWLIEGVTKL
jgi:hypothetical protein